MPAKFKGYLGSNRAFDGEAPPGSSVFVCSECGARVSAPKKALTEFEALGCAACYEQGFESQMTLEAAAAETSGG